MPQTKNEKRAKALVMRTHDLMIPRLDLSKEDQEARTERIKKEIENIESAMSSN